MVKAGKLCEQLGIDSIYEKLYIAAMITVTVDAGVCGFETVIKAESEDMQNVKLKIESNCADIQSMADELKELDAFKENFTKIGESAVYESARRYCKHTACPVPAGIHKAIEAAAGLALPKDASIKVEKT
jgi:hypothetical protein